MSSETDETANQFKVEKHCHHTPVITRKKNLSLKPVPDGPQSQKRLNKITTVFLHTVHTMKPSGQESFFTNKEKKNLFNQKKNLTFFGHLPSTH